MSDNNNWRDRIKEIGKEGYEIEEMVRLGFLTISQEELERIAEREKAYRKLGARSREIEKALEGLEDITPYIKVIREERIERVRKQREIRKVEKAKAEAERKKAVEAKLRSTPTYLGDEISKGIHYGEYDEDRCLENGMPGIRDLDELAEKSGIGAKRWQWLAYHKKVSQIDHYTRFTIPKKSGGKREISSPKSKLREAQEWIKDNVLASAVPHAAAVAYRPGMSVAYNAILHMGSKLVIRMDLKDFFPSVKFPRVKGVFRSSGYSEALATVFASVCTDAFRVKTKMGDKEYYVALGEKALPQGACTSPALTNVLCRKLDKRIANYTKKHGIVYTRYADDLVFSSKTGNVNLKSFFAWIRRIIKEEGFVLNEEKTSVMRPHQRQTVTGVVVNEGGHIRISRRDVRKFRAFVHRLSVLNDEIVAKEIGKNPYSYMSGYMSFVRMVNPMQADKLQAYIDKLHPQLAEA
ncbi:reverse transcriptase [Fulvitalea axinellae]|uniref:RNA-directed DNA polymerase n=1 Tax=Fulvitalea axinellae TaxID=1182444 RepID=A0AAU9CM14_9BACT|nr:reverse transcriptase [Fulvitalea axinellae]